MYIILRKGNYTRSAYVCCTRFVNICVVRIVTTGPWRYKYVKSLRMYLLVPVWIQTCTTSPRKGTCQHLSGLVPFLSSVYSGCVQICKMDEYYPQQSMQRRSYKEKRITLLWRMRYLVQLAHLFYVYINCTPRIIGKVHCLMHMPYVVRLTPRTRISKKMSYTFNVYSCDIKSTISSPYLRNVCHM